MPSSRRTLARSPSPSACTWRSTSHAVPSPELSPSSPRRTMGPSFPMTRTPVKARTGPSVTEFRAGVTRLSRGRDSLAGLGPMAAKRNILVVEDEKDIRELVRFHLEQDGYAVREADTGESALTLVDAERPALVVLDIMLPGIDGLEVCRRLRAAEPTRALPIIVLTARAAEVDRVLGLEFGADDYVTKPFSPRELVA